MHLQVYKEPYCRRHHAAFFSFPVVFRVIGYLIVIVLAYVLAYASGDMWIKRRTDGEQPDVQFAYRAIAHFAVRSSSSAKPSKGRRPEGFRLGLFKLANRALVRTEMWPCIVAQRGAMSRCRENGPTRVVSMHTCPLCRIHPAAAKSGRQTQQ